MLKQTRGVKLVENRRNAVQIIFSCKDASLLHGGRLQMELLPTKILRKELQFDPAPYITRYSVHVANAMTIQ